MKNTIQILKLIFTTLLITTLVVKVSGQGNYKLLKSASNMKVSGTSTVHDWEMDVNSFNSSVSIKEDNNKLTITTLFFLAKANSIKGDKSLMNKKTKEALKADRHSRITFRFTDIAKLNTSSGNFTGTIEGNLTIAGVTRKVNVDFSGKRSGNKLYVNDTHIVNMSDFDIDPPTAMLGSIKTDEKVKISFDLTFETNDLESK